MKRQRVVALVIAIAVALLVAWVMRNTYWDDIDLPPTLQGEAARDPLYAVKSLAQKLGARTSKDSAIPATSADAIIFLTDWTWDLGDQRRRQLERWVESGGRLVIDHTVYVEQQAFQQWSGIEFFQPEVKAAERRRRAADEVGRCEDWQQGGVSPIAGNPVDRRYLVCDEGSWLRVRASRPVVWSVRDRDGMQALRVFVGKGSVTAIASQPFLWRQPLEGDHGELFIAVTQLRGGDHIHFLSEKSHPSLAALAWRHGSPVIVLGALALLLAMWRNGTRLGPLVPAAAPLRRSLVEQIRGTGQFALRYGGGAALHAATARALRNAALRRIPGFAAMSGAEQTAAMAEAGSVTHDAMAAALQTVAPRSRSILSTVALLETVRRRILSGNLRQSHGN